MAFTARFPGRCPGGDAIKPGDRIESAGRGYRHVGCSQPAYRADVGSRSLTERLEADFRDLHDHGGGDCMCFESDDGPSFHGAMAAHVRGGSFGGEYERGRSEGERYQMEKRVYGKELADAWQAEDEFNRFWKYGEDY